MKNKKPRHEPRSRRDISNPYHAIPYDELFRKANVTDLTDNYEIVRSDEKRLIIKPINLNSKAEESGAKL